MTIEYLAGIVDGEGHIGVSYGRGYSLRLTIGMKNKRFLTNLQTFRGGLLSSNASNGCTILYWNGPLAETLLRELLPHLIVKRTIAELALAFRDEQKKARETHPNGTGYPTEIKERLASLSSNVRRAVQQEYN